MYRSLDSFEKRRARFYTRADGYYCLKHDGLIKILANERRRALCAPGRPGAAGPDVFGGTALHISPRGAGERENVASSVRGRGGRGVMNGGAGVRL